MPHVRLKRGGAHNHANRQSWHLREDDCRKVISASMAAWQAGTPLNRFVTIAWGLGGVPADQAVDATGNFVRLAREMMWSRGHHMPWAWVQERGSRFGQHAHILLHVPPELNSRFGVMPLRWTKSILPQAYVRDVLDTRRLWYAGGVNTDAYRAQLLGRLHDMLKAAPIELESAVGMTGCGHKPWGQSCLVIGKRAGVWQGWKVLARTML